MSFYSAHLGPDPLSPATNTPQGVAFELCERCSLRAHEVHRWQGNRRDGKVEDHGHPFFPQIPIKGHEPGNYQPQWLYWVLCLFKCTGNCSMGWYRYEFHSPQHQSSVPSFIPVQSSNQPPYSNEMMHELGSHLYGTNGLLGSNLTSPQQHFAHQPQYRQQQHQHQQQPVTYASVASGKTPPPPSGMAALLPPPSRSPKSKMSLSNSSLAVRTVTSKTSEQTEVTESSITLMGSDTDYASWTALGSSRGGNISRDESAAQRVSVLSSDDTSAHNGGVISLGDAETASALSVQTPHSQRVGGAHFFGTPNGSTDGTSTAGDSTPHSAGIHAGTAITSYANAVSTPRTPVRAVRGPNASMLPTPTPVTRRNNRFNNDEQRSRNFRDKRIRGVCEQCAIAKCRCPDEHNDRRRAEKRARNQSATSTTSSTNQKNTGKKMRSVRSIGSGRG